jgi:hypothetical protein
VEGSYAGYGTGGRTKEIVEIPLCANCVVETETDDQQTLVQKALRRIDKSDGGLSRNRWQAMEGAAGRSGQGRTRRATGTISRVVGDAGHPRPYISRLAADGVGDEPGHDGGNYCNVPPDSTIYVSIHDPLGLPAFKPSPTKPIPRWMQPPWMLNLPNQHQPSRAVEPRPCSILNEHFGDVSSASARRVHFAELDTVCPTAPATAPDQYPSSEWRPRENGLSRGQKVIPVHNTSGVAVPRGPNISFVTSPPLMRPSSRVNRPSSRLNSPNPTYGHSLSRSTSPFPIPPRRSSQKSPLPSICGASSCSPSAQSSDRTMPCQRSTSPRAVASESALSRGRAWMRRTPPPQSKEYLDLYQPTQSGSGSGTMAREGSANVRRATASIAIAGRKRGRVVGNWDGPQAQAGAEAVRSQNRDQGGNQEGSNVHGQDSGEIRSSHSGSFKRSSLHADLRRLFGWGGKNEQ